MNEAKVVDEFAEMRQKVRGHFAGFSSGFKIPERFCDVSRRAFKGHGWDEWRGFPVKFCKGGFVVERIDVTHRSGTEDHEDVFGGSVEMGGPWRVGIFGINIWANRRRRDKSPDAGR